MRHFFLLLAAAGLVPVAAADVPLCADVTDAPANPLGVYPYGDVTRGIEIWLETNQNPGLQRQPCVRDDGSVATPDSFLTATLLV